MWVNSRRMRSSATAAAAGGGLSSDSTERKISAEAFADECTELAVHLLDYLMIRLSALQDSSAMDLYRCYVTILVHLSWPYVELTTAAIFGLVRGISPQVWRRRLPRLFRSSFSHIRVGDGARSYPTDILSLLCNCVGYRDDGSSSSGYRIVRGTQEVEKEMSALHSARRFIVRSFATFARKKRKRHPRTDWTHEAKQATDADNVPSAPPVDLVNMKDKSVKEILHDLLHMEDEEEASVFVALRAAPRYRQQHGGVSMQPVATYPSMLPLAFVAIDGVISGQVEYRQRVRDQQDAQHGLVGGWEVLTSSEALPPKSERGGSLWSLKLSDTDILLTDRWAPSSTNWNRSSGYGAVAEKDLWLNTTIPAARWITAALLVPIGVVVQRLQERRLVDLFRATAVQRALGWRELELDDEPRGEEGLTTVRRDNMRTEVRIPSSFSFMQAVKLLVDVALCRDKQRIFDGFLERLHGTPHWWYRRADAGGTAQYEASGTASTFISQYFSDAVRGKRFGDLVQLSVLPPEMNASASGNIGEDLLMSYEMLDVFASFQLRFCFPDGIALVLLPKELSVYVGHSSSTGNRQQSASFESSYTALFWQRRRGAAGTTAEVTRAMMDDNEEAQAALDHLGQQKGSVSAADVWSYVFGYMCALQYAHMSLRELRKTLHQKDAQDQALLSAMELPRAMAASRAGGVGSLQHIARGLGSAYFSLSFVVDSLQTFTQREASAFIYQLERLFVRAESSHSVMQLCQELDQLLLQLQMVCFPLRPPSPRSDKERRGALALASGERVRECLNAALALALDPSRLPVKLISTRVRNAIEGLVATAIGLQEPAVLKTRLQPLVVLLTFNRFYGSNESPSFQFR